MLSNTTNQRQIKVKCWPDFKLTKAHYSDVIMIAMASQITSLTTVHSTVYSGADQRKSGKCFYLITSSCTPLVSTLGLHGRAMGCSSWVIWRKVTARYREHWHGDQPPPNLLPLWDWNRNVMREISKCHDCWCPGSLRRQAINYHATILIV